MAIVTASIIVDLLVRSLSSSAAEKFASSAAEAAWGGAATAVKKLRDWLVARPRVAPAVEKLESQPTDSKAKEELHSRLEEEIKTDPAFADALNRVAQTVHQDGTFSTQFLAAVETVMQINVNYGGVHVNSSRPR
jgi:hypothetical protein